MIKKKQLVFVFVLAIAFLCACNSKKESTEVKTQTGEEFCLKENDVEWSLHDLNGDGIEDLVRKGEEDSVKPIREILDGKNGQRVFIDEIDMGEYYFVTDKGDLVYHWDYNGIYCFESYEKYVFDVDWNIELESGAYAWWVYDVDEVKYWYDGHDHTDMTRDGAYFTTYSNGEEKGITKEEYIKIFESITGLDFEYLEEDLFWLRKDKEDNLYSWSGVYNYSETFPHAQAEDLNYFIGYKIYIYEKQGEYFAEVSSNGWQIESKSLAYVTGDETSIDLVFMETMPDDSLYGTCERYEKDDVLLSLSWQNGTLETNWKKLCNEHPAFIEIEDEIVGEYFLKKNDEYTE